MKNRLHRSEGARSGDAERRWPGYLFSGRIRTSTVVLIIAFVAVWWVYDTYRPEPTPPAAPQVVPPGFIPDPAYTWVPRTRVRQPPPTTTEIPAPTTETTEPPTSETPTPVPEFPFCPPLCPPPPAEAPPGQIPPSSGQPPPPAAPGLPQPSASPEPTTSSTPVP